MSKAELVSALRNHWQHSSARSASWGFTGADGKSSQLAAYVTCGERCSAGHGALSGPVPFRVGGSQRQTEAGRARIGPDNAAGRVEGAVEEH